MKRLLIAVIGVILVLGFESDARRSGGSFGGSSSRRSSSFSSPSRKSTPTRQVTKKSTIKKTKTSTKEKPKAVSKSTIDRKQKKALVKKDKEAAKKYGTKAKAETAYRSDLKKKSTYTSPTPPDTRPKHIPEHVSVNNQQVNVVYGNYGGGTYGYGYYDPMGTFMAIAAADMIVDAHMMRTAGYGQWNAQGRPIVHNPVTAGAVVTVFVGIILIGGLIVFIIKIAS